MARRGAAAHLAQKSDRVRQRELLAGESGDEPAAANLSSRLEPPIDAQKIAPRRQPSGLLHEKAPEDDAVTIEQRPRRMFDRQAPELLAPLFRLGAIDHRPAAAALDVEAHDPPAPPRASEEGLALARWRDESAQAREAVGAREPQRHKFAERLLELMAQEMREVHELVEEQRATPLEAVEHGFRAPAQAGRAAQRRKRHPQRRPATLDEGDRGRADRRRMARAAIAVGGGGRRQTGPGRAAGQALGVEPRGLIALEPRRQDLGLPGFRRRLEAFERIEDDGERFGPLEARFLRDMLP